MTQVKPLEQGPIIRTNQMLTHYLLSVLLLSRIKWKPGGVQSGGCWVLLGAPLCTHYGRLSKQLDFPGTCVYVCVCTRAQSCPTLCGPMHCSWQAPLSVEFSRQEYWSGCLFQLQGIFRIQGLNPLLLRLLHWQADYFIKTTSTTWEAPET